MINWIDSQEKKPPQNKKLLWCRAIQDINGKWEYFNVGIGKYRFGNVKSRNIYGLNRYDIMPHSKIFWSEFNEPVIMDVK